MSAGAKKLLIKFVETCLGVWLTACSPQCYMHELYGGTLTLVKLQELEWRAGEVGSGSFDQITLCQFDPTLFMQRL